MFSFSFSEEHINNDFSIQEFGNKFYLSFSKIKDKIVDKIFTRVRKEIQKKITSSIFRILIKKNIGKQGTNETKQGREGRRWEKWKRRKIERKRIEKKNAEERGINWITTFSTNGPLQRNVERRLKVNNGAEKRAERHTGGEEGDREEKAEKVSGGRLGQVSGTRTFKRG